MASGVKGPPARSRVSRNGALMRDFPRAASAPFSITPSHSTQFALILDARVAGQAVEVTAQYTGPPQGAPAGGSWKLAWSWYLGATTLDDVAGKVWPALGRLPEGIGEIQPGSIHAEYFSGASGKGFSFGLGDLSFVYVAAAQGGPGAPTC
jgi:hypothetical protein